jgi:hypothetical protein
MRNFQKYTDLMEKENEIHNSNNYDVIDILMHYTIILKRLLLKIRRLNALITFLNLIIKGTN